MDTFFYHYHPSAEHTMQVPDTRVDYAATVGFFDGVHLGHQHVIHELKLLAAQHRLQTMVITFDVHPRQVVQPQWKPQLLTSLQQKEALLRLTGIDLLVVLHFTPEMAQLSAHDFMQQVLARDLRVKALLTGYDNRFGHDRTEGFEQYADYGRQLHIQVVAGTPFQLGSQRVCSSLVRRLLIEGCIGQANACLARPYSLTGTVGHGHEIGRTLGFPTANLVPDYAHALIPASGVYAVRVRLDNDSTVRQGVMNIGTRPTFDNQGVSIEINILDFIGDLYGHRLSVEFVERLRGEQRFPSPEALVGQMHIDAQQTRTILNNSKQLSNHYE